jgi:cysteinyl-tRNA synthetase
MPLVLYNTLTRQLEPFSPREPGVVRMYNCGPTVYSDPHIGNFRSFLFADVLRRTLELLGFRVDQVMNLTDVGHLTQDDVEAGEDKIEAAARRQRRTPEEIADHYADEFFAISRLLNMRPALRNPKAREHIPEMLALIRVLVDRGMAYVVNGNVYYDVTRFPGYGRLSGNSLEELQAGARIEVNAEKRNPLDFALWKQDPKHLMQWDSPWGRGFPGWHIECSAMSMKYLGEELDIHTGGEDNIFPHHECEIAQSEAVTGRPFARHWLHARHLLVDGKKMSKSLGNFHTVKSVLDRGYDPRVLRFALIRAHYRQPLNFTFEGMDAARETLGRLRDFRRSITAMASAPPSGGAAPAPEAGALLEQAETGFHAGLEDDINMSQALAALFDLVSAVNRLGTIPADAASRVAAFLDRADGVLGVLDEGTGADALDPALQAMLEARAAARKRKDFAESDRLRAELRAKGVLVEDTPRGQVWKRAL